MLKLLCLYLYVYMCVEYVLGGIEIGFLKWLSFVFFFKILKGLYGLYWLYSPSNREKVAMYGGRSLVGLRQCRVSSQDKKRERGEAIMGPYFGVVFDVSSWKNPPSP